MLRDFDLMTWCDRVRIAAVVSLAFVVSACSAGSVGAPSTSAAPAAPSPVAASAPPPPPPAPSSPSLKDKISNFFSTSSAKAPQAVANAQPNVSCPFIDIREGASTLTVPPPPPDGSNEAMSLKYQGTFVRAARECAVANNQMVMKVGIQGRIIIGPAGVPGQIEVPLRIAIVDSPATSAAKTVFTKLIRIPVTIGPADQNTDFTHIEEGISFPLPTVGSLDDYIVYIGFDPLGAAAQDQAKPRPAAKPKPKSKPNPDAPTG